MGKAVQYYNGMNWYQFGISESDYTLDGVVADRFLCAKDNNDNLYIVCMKIGQNVRAKIIKITKTGNKTIATLNWDYSGFYGIYRYDIYAIGEYYYGDNPRLIINADGVTATIHGILSSLGINNYIISKIPLDFTDGELITEPAASIASGDVCAVYAAQYIWTTGGGGGVKVYDYNDLSLLDSVLASSANAICVDNNGVCYVLRSNTSPQLNKYTYIGGVLSGIDIILVSGELSDAKQILVDKWGDLIILTNSGTVSTLLKYTNTGTLIDTITLDNPSYNLNTDKNGNYYYSTALNTYKITANTAQGQAFTSIGTSIRNSGMTTYGNNITGYNPAVFG